jgi:hypothetical protein
LTKTEDHDITKNQVPSSSEDNLIHPDALDIFDEKWWKFVLQVLVPLMVLGVGTIAAGTMLGNFEVSFNVFLIELFDRIGISRHGQCLLRFKNCSYWSLL